MDRRRRVVALLAFLLFALAPALAQTDYAPTGTNSSDNNTSCDGTIHPTVDDDPDSPGGDWCTADTGSGSGSSDWTFKVTFSASGLTLDTGTDVQVAEYYVRSAAAGGSDPTIQLDIYDGTSCADLHESGTSNTVTSRPLMASFRPACSAA